MAGCRPACPACSSCIGAERFPVFIRPIILNELTCTYLSLLNRHRCCLRGFLRLYVRWCARRCAHADSCASATAGDDGAALAAAAAEAAAGARKERLESASNRGPGWLRARTPPLQERCARDPRRPGGKLAGLLPSQARRPPEPTEAQLNPLEPAGTRWNPLEPAGNRWKPLEPAEAHCNLRVPCGFP